MSPRTIRLLPLVLLCLSVAGCGDTAPTASERIPPPPTRPSLTVTAIDAYSTADQYDERQPLAPFGISEWEFNEDPELVTDDQFTQQGESTLNDWEVPQIESDAYEVEEHASACDGYHYSSGGGGGSPDPFSSTIYFYDRCDALYKSCTSRCRRIRSPKGRAACWIACMAAYAICRANK